METKKKHKIIVSWSMTHACNEKCKYCFSPKPGKTLSETEQQIIQKQLIDNGTTGNYYIGGEILLVKQLPKLAAEAHEHGIDTRLSTNGILLTEDKLKEIKTCMNQIALPFESLNDELNEKIRGTKKHRQIITSRIAMIKDVSPEIELQINTCVHKQNIAEIEELGGFLQEQGVDRWKLRRFAPIDGRGKINKEEFFITEDEYEQVLSLVKEKYPGFNIDKKTSSDLALRLMISPQGDLYRMPKLGENNDFIFGNLISDKLDIKRIAEQELGY